MSETWKPVPGYERYYEVSNLGQVKSLWKTKPHIMKQASYPNGYLFVNLYRPREKAKPYMIHKLVMMAFVGERPLKAEINHINGVKTDNQLNNLEYVTSSQNKNHAKQQLGIIYGFKKGENAGEKHPQAKLSEEQVKQIRLSRSKGVSGTVLAQEYNVTPGLICSIFKRRVWKHF